VTKTSSIAPKKGALRKKKVTKEERVDAAKRLERKRLEVKWVLEDLKDGDGCVLYSVA
jgi:hypothetical protein